LVDTRTETQQRAQGLLPGALRIDRTVLEWRLDPRSDHRIAAATSYDQLVILVCSQGYSSSIAAAELQRIGLRNATDMIEGVEGWRAAGLPLLPYTPILEACIRSVRPLGDRGWSAAGRDGLLPVRAGNIERVG
jgi:rhodanese-related sulfurtransferase